MEEAGDIPRLQEVGRREDGTGQHLSCRGEEGV